MKNQEEADSINTWKSTNDLIENVRDNLKRTDSGCMLYYVNDKPIRRVTVAGQQRRLRRLYYLSVVEEAETQLKRRKLLRNCTNQDCIEPSHQRVVRLELKVLLTSFHPVTHRDYTQTLHIPV